MIELLRNRFFENMARHPELDWNDIEKRLLAAPEAVTILEAMEESGGEPDVVAMKSGQYIFFDCSAETPSGRRSLCFDEAALAARKKNPPGGSAQAQCRAIGAEMMNEEEYRYLQTLGSFDLKTSSWIATPEEIRALGGALFCERRYGRVFTFHNGADSYYGVRGWRGVLRLNICHI